MAGVVRVADVLNEDVLDTGLVQEGVGERHHDVVVAAFDDCVLDAGAGHRAVAVQFLHEAGGTELLVVAGDVGLVEGILDLLVRPRQRPC